MATPDSITFSNEAQGMGYSLGGKHRAADRLNLQHYLWREALGYNVHPAVQLPRDAAIADVAAGSGLWMMEVARALPHARVHGLDVDLSQAPHAHWLPPNARLSTWDMFQEPPAELHGAFDFVHLRILVLVLEPAQVPDLLRRLKMLLRPGGWVQWDELDPSRISLKKADEAQSTPALDELERMSRSDGRYDWTARLGRTLEAAGLKVVAEEPVGDPPHLVRAYNDLHLLTMDEFAARLLGAGKKEPAEHFYKTIQDAYQESLGGAAMCIPRVIYVAKMA